MGSFRLAAGRLHHHKHFNFAESLEETVWPSLRHSCGSELTRQEFRYLRTVIVTAAVYWDFNQELAPHHLIFQHRAGVRPYTSTFVLAESCVFGKQLQPPILCDPLDLRMYSYNLPGHTFSRSYGINLPSSFSRVLSSALEFSSYPPVSVCGTVNC